MRISDKLRIRLLDLFRGFMITLLLFANFVFQDTIYQLLYYEIIIAALVITLFYITIHTATIRNILRDKHVGKYLLWIIVLFLFYLLHYYLGPINKVMLPYSMLSQGIIVICVILYLCDLQFDEAMHLFIIYASIASVLSLAYYMYFIYDILGNLWLLNARLSINDHSLPNINLISQSVFVISTLTLYQAFFKEKINKIYALLFLLQFIFIVFSGTKRAIIGLPVFIIVLTFLKNPKSFYKYIIPLILTISFMVYLLINNELLYKIVGERLEGMFYTLGIIQNNRFDIGDNSTNIRKELFVAALKMIPDTPFWGHGLGYFETHSGLNTNIQTFHSHNNYIELFLCYGIFGFILYYNTFILTTYRLIKKRKKSNISFMFLAFFFVLYLIIEPSSVTFCVLPTYYLYLYFAYIYSWKRGPDLPYNHRITPQQQIYR